MFVSWIVFMTYNYKNFNSFCVYQTPYAYMHTVSNMSQKYTEQKQNTYHNNFIVKKDSQLKICG